MSHRREATVHERSAGAVVYHEGSDDARDYLLLRYGNGSWGFPKGHVEAGETDLQAARRELTEETAIPPEAQRFVDDFIEPTQYTFRRGRVRVKKEAVFFLVASATRNVTLSREHTAFAWLPFRAALAQLDFKGPKRALRRAEAHLARAHADA